MERYTRQLLLDGFDSEKQEKLASSHIFIAGIGGLGGTAAIYLAAAGVGNLTLLHDGVIDLPDMNRQILMKDAQIGKSRVKCARETLLEFNPNINIQIINDKVQEDSIRGYIGDSDIILDCRHNFGERYTLNKVTIALNKPIIEAAMSGMEGYLTVFDTSKGTPCLSCLYPVGVPDWDYLGFPVLGAVSGMLGTLAAIETIKVLTGLGTPLYSQKLYFDMARMEFRKFNIKQNQDCPVCSKPAIRAR